MEATYFPKSVLAFTELHGVIAHKTELIIHTDV
jgi:hypothetical protein